MFQSIKLQDKSLIYQSFQIDKSIYKRNIMNINISKIRLKEEIVNVRSFYKPVMFHCDTKNQYYLNWCQKGRPKDKYGQQVIHLKYYISHDHFMFGCCEYHGYPKYRPHQFQIIDIDKQIYVGSYQSLKSLTGRRLAVTFEKNINDINWAHQRKEFDKF